MEQFLQKLSSVKLCAFDFDGTMTDGFVYVDQNGEESVVCSRRDSFGILMIKKLGIVVGVISYESNPVVMRRCEKIMVPCWSGVKSGEGKKDILARIAKEQNIAPEEVLYMGDDVSDVSPMQFAGIKVTVADGHERLRAMADYITTARGGDHAIREVCELILKAKGVEPAV